MKMEQAERFETSAYKIRTPRNYPEENIQQIDLFSSSDIIEMINSRRM
jgi:hypothetical protein